MILIDSDVLIDVSRSVPEALKTLQLIEADDEPVVSVITQMELIVGCRDLRELRSLEKFLEAFRIFKLSEPISDLAVNLLRRYRLSHGLLLADSLIAASAIIHGVPFVSKNSKHFRFIDGLTLLSYPW
ncbi:MAG TPA: type II toxin-antitoxin system VapC family toxin [Thermoanaerobaculia bacterium]|nr:type II toxin-antitoxin system VapC family toxin [Thermoanaerobaculia bacterium]